MAAMAEALHSEALAGLSLRTQAAPGSPPVVVEQAGVAETPTPVEAVHRA